MAKVRGLVPSSALVDTRRLRIVHARFTATEFVALDASARAAQMTVSAFLRSLALEGAGVQPFFSDEDVAVLEVLISDLRSLSLDLNHTIRFFNAGRSHITADMASKVADAQQLVAAVLLEMKRFAARGVTRRRGVV